MSTPQMTNYRFGVVVEMEFPGRDLGDARNRGLQALSDALGEGQLSHPGPRGGVTHGQVVRVTGLTGGVILAELARLMGAEAETGR